MASPTTSSRRILDYCCRPSSTVRANSRKSAWLRRSPSLSTSAYKRPGDSHLRHHHTSQSSPARVSSFAQSLRHRNLHPRSDLPSSRWQFNLLCLSLRLSSRVQRNLNTQTKRWDKDSHLLTLFLQLQCYQHCTNRMPPHSPDSPPCTNMSSAILKTQFTTTT